MYHMTDKENGERISRGGNRVLGKDDFARTVKSIYEAIAVESRSFDFLHLWNMNGPVTRLVMMAYV